jgi:hypothetical protein
LAGDTERKIAIGVRIGASEEMPLLFHCHNNGKPIGATVKIHLAEGVYGSLEPSISAQTPPFLYTLPTKWTR